ncbi:MAG: DUF1549 and DUF1553 domain-containing protein, partial [Verrucomicrobia bacterium]|nr:DUF1549 and DUF1553 domain-containing protein [Verrucomicrobiota bacterium]
RKNKVNFAPEASRRVLARRLAFDLTGLPPDPELVRAFESDNSPDAYEKLVNQFLSNPGFGERFGRHWLDVARYADTRGYVFQSERRFPYSYTYRDYVIRSFNQDKPINQFIIEQIAADKLVEKTGDKSSLAALGYLTLGRRFLNNQHDIIDDRIDVTTRGLMGLTVVCARCHDHKYDPIPTADYYSLYGVFASSEEPSEYPLLDFNPDDPKYLEFKIELERRETESTNFRQSNQENAIRKAQEQSADYLKIAAETLSADDGARENAARNVKLDPGILKNWHNLISNPNPNQLSQTFWQPLIHLAQFRQQEIFSIKLNEYLLSQSTSSDPALRLVIQSVSQKKPDDFGQLIIQYGEILSSSLNSQDPAYTPVKEWLISPQAPPTISLGDATRLLDVPTQEKIRRLQREIEEHIATHPGAPPRGMTLVDKSTPVQPVIFERGSPGRRGPQVPRQFLAILSDSNRQPFQSGSGRLEMAEKIASDTNPLTARVFVNRVWGHLIGRPLVSTPSDFGIRSDLPSHPELLDYLASTFIESGWSLKKLIHHIVTSNTYKQQSFRSDGFSSQDPDNKWLWKMNRKRLEFEPMRDQILLLANQLDQQQGGLPVQTFEPPFEPRRSIYGFIERQNLPGVLKTFDFASPDATSPGRFQTVVPQQALFLMNNPWLQEQSRNFSSRIQSLSPNSTESQIKSLFQTAFQRVPSTDESQWCQEFLLSKTSPEPAISAPENTWSYGTIHLDPESLTSHSFTPFPHFGDSTWKGGQSVPDETIGWALLNRDGGHPGKNPRFAVARRWTAPFSGSISVEIILTHTSEPGDGVRMTVHHQTNRTPAPPILAHNNSQSVTLGEFTIQQGQFLDFIVDCLDNESHDSFQSLIGIRLESSDFSQSFNSRNDFSRPGKLPSPLSPMDQLAQIILMSNEAIFID